MPFNQQTIQEAQAIFDSLPPVMTVVMVALVILGLVLWLAGRKIVGFACAVSGLVLGAVAGLAVGQRFAEQGAYILPLIIGGGIAGALLAALMFRVWMALSGAAILALAAPAIVLAWQGTPLEVPVVEPAATTQTAEEMPAEAPASEQGAALAQHALDAAQTWYDQQVAALKAWWQDLMPSIRAVIYAAALAGGVLGLLIGLIAPKMAASFETALVGGLLLLLPGRELIIAHAPDVAGYLPQSPRGLVIWLGLITLLGFLLQWTLFGRKTDK